VSRSLNANSEAKLLRSRAVKYLEIFLKLSVETTQTEKKTPSMHVKIASAVTEERESYFGYD